MRYHWFGALRFTIASLQCAHAPVLRWSSTPDEVDGGDKCERLWWDALHDTSVYAGSSRGRLPAVANLVIRITFDCAWIFGPASRAVSNPITQSHIYASRKPFSNTTSLPYLLSSTEQDVFLSGIDRWSWTGSSRYFQEDAYVLEYLECHSHANARK